MLGNRYLVQNIATFRFAGFRGYDESDIAATAVFGFGTDPDSEIVVPEPDVALLAAVAALLLLSSAGLRRLP